MWTGNKLGGLVGAIIADHDLVVAQRHEVCSSPVSSVEAGDESTRGGGSNWCR